MLQDPAFVASLRPPAPPSYVTTQQYHAALTEMNGNIMQQQAANATVATQIASLNASVAKLSADLAASQRANAELSAALVAGTARMTAFDANLAAFRAELADFSTKISRLLAFVPRFVRETSAWFTRLLAGVKGGNVADLEVPAITEV